MLPTVRVILVSGIPGAGKTTVARLLAERFERSVHLASASGSTPAT